VPEKSGEFGKDSFSSAMRGECLPSSIPSRGRKKRSPPTPQIFKREGKLVGGKGKDHLHSASGRSYAISNRPRKKKEEFAPSG